MPVAGTQGEVSELRNRVTELETVVTKRDERIITYDQELGGMRSRNQLLVDENTRLQTENSTMGHEIRGLNYKVECLAEDAAYTDRIRTEQGDDLRDLRLVNALLIKEIRALRLGEGE